MYILTSALMKTEDKITCRKWDKDSPPVKILIIRFHAIGDTAITFPVCAGFKKLYPDTQIDYLCGSTSSGLLKSSDIFSIIYETSSQINISIIGKLQQKLGVIKLGRLLRNNHYDIIIDLQHNRNSRIVRKLTGVKYWSEFGRYAPKPASERTLAAFHNAGFKQVDFDFDWKLKTGLIENAKKLLLAQNWSGKEKLIILNPAGLWITRNWDIDNYISIAEKFLNDFDAKFILLGTERMSEKSNYLTAKLGDKIINLTGKTSLPEAMAIIKLCSLMVSEDSALFHMAWAVGIPSVLLLGSTRADWTCHNSKHVICLNSNDLPCGNCMAHECKYGDVHCLTRFTPELVYEKAKGLFSPPKP